MEVADHNKLIQVLTNMGPEHQMRPTGDAGGHKIG